MFKFDEDDIRLKSKDVDSKTRNNLKDFINDKISNLMIQFKKSILNSSKEDFLTALEEFKSISM